MSKTGTEKVRATNKQYKIEQNNTYYFAKERCLLSRRPHLDIKEVEILTQFDLTDDIKIVIETKF